MWHEELSRRQSNAPAVTRRETKGTPAVNLNLSLNLSNSNISGRLSQERGRQRQQCPADNDRNQRSLTLPEPASEATGACDNDAGGKTQRSNHPSTEMHAAV